MRECFHRTVTSGSRWNSNRANVTPADQTTGLWSSNNADTNLIQADSEESNDPMNRSALYTLSATSCLALTIAACGSPSSQGSDTASSSFTFAGFGGALQEAQKEAWFAPFTQESGITVNEGSTPDVAALKTQIDSGNVQWDVVQESQYQADIGCGTLYEEIPDVDRSQIAPEYITNDCGVPVVKFSFVLAYNATKFPSAPTSLGDFVNTTTFPGTRAASEQAQEGALEAALLGDGVPADQLYPLDYERGIRKLESAKGDITFRSTFAEIQDGLANGNFDMAVLPNARALKASEINPDIKVVWQDAVTLFDNAVMVKGAPNAEAAKTFLAYVSQAQTQAALAERLPYGVLTSGPAPELSPEMEAYFPDAPDHAQELLYQDQQWWGENRDAVVTAWTSFISG
jgi:putative spermidine/putrescine transport system substrate-binding protein